MAIRRIDQACWGSYFHAFSLKLSREHRSDYAAIRVFSLESGAQPGTRWLPLSGIIYDAKEDLLQVMVQNLDHLIAHPKEIYVDEEDGVITSMAVVREDGTKEVIELR